MTINAIKQMPLSLRSAQKGEVRTQIAALCYRTKKDQTEVLLVTTRRTGRWFIPKGWPMHGKTPGAIAGQEAWEEAGVNGMPVERCLGLISYKKYQSEDDNLPVIAMVYPVLVKSLSHEFPESGQRRRKWFTLSKAAKKVEQEDLAAILKSFDPKVLR